jgi:hypothetical protein
MEPVHHEIDRTACIVTLKRERTRVKEALDALGVAPAYASVEYYLEKRSITSLRFELGEELAGIDALIAFYESGVDVTLRELSAQAEVASRLLYAASKTDGAMRTAIVTFKELVRAGKLPETLTPRREHDDARAADELGVALETDA